MMPLEAQKIVDFYGMSRIPHEGPWFLQTHLSDDRVAGDIAKRYPGPRSLYSSIVAVMTRTDFSEMHRLATDEMWHFYDGTSLTIHMIHPDGNHQSKILGKEITADESLQIVVA
ncbi:MAG: cupin domain-containing protein, partial [Gammaproteobacteria bacterium]|nr:cupin domain-containing protein [Gammaproteobacteria bacterium]